MSGATAAGEPELFDLYDAEGRPLGRTKPRADVHRDGDWHRSAHVWIFTGDGQSEPREPRDGSRNGQGDGPGGGRLLFQRRALDKDTWPGRLDASVGGHYRAGEGTESVLREIREELGLVIAPEELIPLGVRRVESVESVPPSPNVGSVESVPPSPNVGSIESVPPSPGVESVEPVPSSPIVDRELQDVYLLRRDLPLTAYRPDPVELDALALLDVGGAVRLHAVAPDPADDAGAPGGAVSLRADLLPVGATSVQAYTFTPRDVIPGRERYIAAVARAVGDMLAGRPPGRL